jgi:hypothetical protein
MSDKPPLKKLAPLDMYDMILAWPILIPMWIVAALIRLPWCIWKAWRTMPPKRAAPVLVKAHAPLSEATWERMRANARQIQ